MPKLKPAQARRQKRLTAALNLSGGGGAASAQPDRAVVAIAKRLYSMRRCRSELLGDKLFGEPAWDMLLDLIISQSDRGLISVSSLCIGSACSSTTALRYLRMMEEGGLVQRVPDQDDGRRTFVRLTATGTATISEVLLASGC